MAIEGTEVVNAARTRRYLLNGYGPPRLKVEGDCGCDETQLRALVGCDPDPYSNPADDLAPWYDPAFPESADFAGFWPTTFTGLESTYTRDVTPVATGGGGGVIGRLRAAPRTMTWHGYLFGRTCCAVAYGLRWLTSVLRQSRCGAECGGERMDLLVCCPPQVEEPTDCGCAVLSPPGIPADDDAFRTLYNTGLVEGPLVKSERGASGRCGCSTITEIEFSIVAGNPHLYRQPILLADKLTFEVGLCPEWVRVTDPADCPPPAAGIFSPLCDVAPAAAVTDPRCSQPTLPVITTVAESCFCDPYAPSNICVPVPASTFGMNFQGAPVFQIYSGSAALRSTTFRIVENPLGLDCATITAAACNFCDFISIRYLPAYATLTVDGVNRRVTIETAGGDIQSGEQFMVGSYTWPMLECVDYCVCATVDGFTAAADASFSLSIYPVEM
jgi:hypothetical protein